MFPDFNYSQQASIAIIAHITTNFPTVIIRELGAQHGMITGLLDLEKSDITEDSSEDWFGNLSEKIFIEINKKLKLFRD